MNNKDSRIILEEQYKYKYHQKSLKMHHFLSFFIIFDQKSAKKHQKVPNQKAP